MAASKGNRQKKGKFGPAELPVSSSYLYPKSRRTFLFAGGAGVLFLVGLYTMYGLLSGHSPLASGPLSTNHAGFETQCSTCHTPNQGVTDAKCAACHEKYGDKLGIHTFETHYLYRSGDFTRVVPAVNEGNCSTCHGEHMGREAAITRVTDATCATCHDINAFEDDHPEFQFAAENLPDDANLRFPHTQHVNELERREHITDVEKTCLYCHNANADGKGFQPIDFDRHCDACHLPSNIATPFLSIDNGNNPPQTPGVATLERIQATGRAGTRWAYYTNPAEFQSRGNAVRKRPLYHRDPWILENLRRLRDRLYPGNDLADLIRVSATVGVGETDVLYREAIQTLRQYIEELRNQPASTVQSELENAESLLGQVERRLQDPYGSRDETRFSISAADIPSTFTPEDVANYNRFIEQLTQPCQMCHLVEQATIQRVQKSQKTLVRAEFNHRAHIIQTRCLDCHSMIPIEQFAAADSIPPVELDHAALQNLPTIATCQSCHSDSKASNTCITCHEFHPDKSQHANLLLYVE